MLNKSIVSIIFKISGVINGEKINEKIIQKKKKMNSFLREWDITSSILSDYKNDGSISIYIYI